jgi:hypothetical protein
VEAGTDIRKSIEEDPMLHDAARLFGIEQE